MKKRSWTVNRLRSAVKNSFSFRQVIKELGLRPSGGNYEQVRKYIKENNLSTKHFKGRGWNAGLRIPRKPIIPLNEILVRNSSFQSYKLKKRLFEANLKPRHCEMCGWAKTSETGYLPLELDHINGNRYDNRLENLRILCPNCHSLTPTYRSRQRRVNN